MEPLITVIVGSTSNHSSSAPYHYIPALSFETGFREIVARRWMADHWRMSLLFCLAYGFVILALKGLMSGSHPLSLKRHLVAWNVSMALFSVLGTLRTWPELLQVLRDLGLRGSVCHLTSDPVSAYWSWLFVLSKVPELGDTVFVVLRKQKLIFLHWYHHMTVLAYCWYTYKEQAALGRWFTCANFAVHALMYSYFALRSLKFRVPRLVAMVVTVAQIAQMILGASLSIYSFWVLRERSAPCAMSKKLANLSLILYGTYLILFVRFFCASYLQPKKVHRE